MNNNVLLYVYIKDRSVYVNTDFFKKYGKVM